MRHFRGWRWEQVWIGQAVTSNLLFPLLALVLCRQVMAGAAGVSVSRLLEVVLFGVIWGMGGIGYGLSLALLGLSFTYSILFTTTTVVGALVPLWIGVRSEPVHWYRFWAGVNVCVLGSVAMGRAATLRAREASNGADAFLPMPVPRMPFGVTLLVALGGGVFSTSMGLSMVVNRDLVNRVLHLGASPVLAPLIVWVPLNIGSAAAALSYGLWAAHRSSSSKNLYQKYPWRNWLLALLMGALGFGGLLAYGFGTVAAGHPAPNVTWAAFMTSFILGGNLLGWANREWAKCSRGVLLRASAGAGLLLCAIGLLACA